MTGTKAKPKKAAQTSPAPGTASDVGAFKQRASGMILGLPSGLSVRARRVDLQTFVRQGQVPNALMAAVESAISKGQEVDLEKVVDPDNLDIEKLNEMYELVETVVCTVVIEPKIHRKPESEDEREDDKVYVDEIDDDDKMFLFQWASGGTADLAQFRAEAEDALAFVAQVQGRKQAAK